MKKLLIAAVFGLALPTAAHAADAPKMDCCEKMKAEGKKCCCEDMDRQHDGEHSTDKADHAGHDMSNMEPAGE